MKYFKDTNSEIFGIGDGQDELIQEGWIEISKEEMLAITNPPKTPEEIEAIRIQSINNKAGEIITNKYPLYKQNNITLLLNPCTEIDLEEMKIFIETVRGIAKDAKNNGTQLENINWVGLDK